MKIPFGVHTCLLLGLVACASEEDESTTRVKECTRMRDHLIDLRLEGTQEQDAHRAAMKQALGEEFIVECVQKMTSQQVRCSTTAKDTEAAMKCGSADSVATKK